MSFYELPWSAVWLLHGGMGGFRGWQGLAQRPFSPIAPSSGRLDRLPTATDRGVEKTSETTRRAAESWNEVPDAWILISLDNRNEGATTVRDPDKTGRFPQDTGRISLCIKLIYYLYGSDTRFLCDAQFFSVIKPYIFVMIIFFDERRKRRLRRLPNQSH